MYLIICPLIFNHVIRKHKIRKERKVSKSSQRTESIISDFLSTLQRQCFSSKRSVLMKLGSTLQDEPEFTAKGYDPQQTPQMEATTTTRRRIGSRKTWVIHKNQWLKFAFRHWVLLRPRIFTLKNRKVADFFTFLTLVQTIQFEAHQAKFCSIYWLLYTSCACIVV